MRQLQQLTGWAGGNVLYFGDHPYTDLADVRLHHGWRTGAILWELDVSTAGGKRGARFLQIRLRHESRDKYVIHISKTAFKKNAILKRRITMGALWGCRTSHVVNDPPLFRWGVTYWYVAIEVNFFPKFK